jgi:hypothetical protein
MIFFISELKHGFKFIYCELVTLASNAHFKTETELIHLEFFFFCVFLVNIKGLFTGIFRACNL